MFACAYRNSLYRPLKCKSLILGCVPAKAVLLYHGAHGKDPEWTSKHGLVLMIIRTEEGKKRGEDLLVAPA